MEKEHKLRYHVDEFPGMPWSMNTVGQQRGLFYDNDKW